MKFLIKVTFILFLLYSITLSNEDWNWEIIPSNPTELDTIIVSMSFLSGYSLDIESEHTIVGQEITIIVTVTSGMLPIDGWFGHADTIGCLNSGTYNCTIIVDYYYWDISKEQFIYEGSDNDNGSFVVQSNTHISNELNYNDRSQNLLQNYPNPFNSDTLIRYSVIKSGKIRLEVFDIRGNKILLIFDKFHRSGEYSIHFSANLLPSGTYICCLSTENSIFSNKMTVLK